MVSVIINSSLAWLPASLQLICVFVVEAFMMAFLVGVVRSLLKFIPIIGKFF